MIANVKSLLQKQYLES